MAVRRSRHLVLALAFACLVAATAFTAASRPVSPVVSLWQFWREVSGPDMVEYRPGSAGGTLTVRCTASGSKVTVAADGRELWWEITGAPADAQEDLVAGDDLVPAYHVVQAGPDLLVVRLQLQAYVGHSVEVGDGLATLTVTRSPLVGRKIVLDPGHGGRDPGCVGAEGLLEADLTLAVATQLRPLLQVAGASVRLTRDAETDFDLYSYRTMDSLERIAVANEWQADAFLAIHFNSYKSPRYGGTEVWHRGDDPQSLQLAELLQQRLTDLGLGDRGIRAGDYVVLRAAEGPAVLAELGFLSCPADLAFFAEAANLETTALLIYQALLEYFR